MLARPEIGSKAHIKLWLGSKDPSEVGVWEDLCSCFAGRYSQEHFGRAFPWSPDPEPRFRDELKRLSEITGPTSYGAGDACSTMGEAYQRVCAAWSECD